jgi:hypothetical protein
MPLMVITGQLNEKLKVAIEKALVEIKKITPAQENKDPQKPLCTIVFDREAYEPQWFKKLWEDEHIAVLSYRKNVKDKWAESLFENVEVKINNVDVTMRLCEMGSLIGGRWFREIGKRSDNGHQTAIITTHPRLELAHVALKMFARWSQENFFKYMIANFDFDKMMEYGTEELKDKTIKIPNPIYKQLSYQIKQTREKKARLEAKIYQKIDPENIPTLENLQKVITMEETAIEQINAFMEEIHRLVAERKTVPARISMEQLPPEKQYNMLKQESKKLKNIILMLAYRSESALYSLLPECYANTNKDGRQLLKEIFTADADFIPDDKKQTVTIRLHALSTPRANKAAKKLCDILNQTESRFPSTNLKLIYDSVAF